MSKDRYIPLPCSIPDEQLEEQNGCIACANCDKRLIDLRGKSDEEISTLVSRTENPCVIIDGDNRDPLLDHIAIASLRRFLIASVFIFGASLYTNAHELKSNLVERYSILEKDSSHLFKVKLQHVKRTSTRCNYKAEDIKRLEDVKVVCPEHNIDLTLEDMFLDEDGYLHIDLSNYPILDEEDNRDALIYVHVKGYKPKQLWPHWFTRQYVEKNPARREEVGLYRTNQRTPRRRVGTCF